MTRILISILFFLNFLFSCNVHGQQHRLYELDAKLKKGNKSALLEIADFFDNDKKIVEFLGHHKLKNSESSIAKRIVLENSMFLNSELMLTDKTNKIDFVNFIQLNNENIIFSTLADAFIITPFENRQTKYEIVSLTNNRKTKLLNDKDRLMSLEWVKKNGIDKLINQKDPKALLKISSILVKWRARFNYYQWNEDEIIDLIQLLTHTIIAVPNEKGKLSYQIDKDLYSTSRINLLIFFAKHHSQYKWDEEKSSFVHSGLKIKKSTNERGLFELLGDKNDAIAMNAFIELTKLNPHIVIKLANEYEEANISKNYILPTSPYRFLKQLVTLTNYCNIKNIDFIGSSQLQASINKLKINMTFSDRYKLENKIISELIFDDITAFEYWSLIYGSGFGQNLTYSSGRILDKFYSEYWEELISDSTQLELFLKKSSLFDQLGTIGICSNYHIKFLNSTPKTIQLLSELQSNDPDIKKQIDRILHLNREHRERPKKIKKEWDGNKYSKITNLEQRLSELTTDVQDSTKTEYALVDVLAQISYEQIGIALEGIENYQFKSIFHKYRFMENDWGFLIDSYSNDSFRQDFLINYSKMSEYELYSYYLDKANIHYMNNDKTLDYDKIYEMLKYDIVVAFVGGGGGKRNNQVYSLIKLLELKFNTTLGYPKKLCNSRNMYSCYADDRAWDWMEYLEEKKLLKKDHNTPVSFNYEIK